MSKQIKSADFKAYLSESQGLERDYLGELVKSRSLAWNVAKASGLLAAVAVIALATLAPLKRVEPYVVVTNGATGTTDVVTRMADAKSTYGENTDKAFLNQYVLNRESYDYDTLQLNYETTALLSSPAVQTQYFALYRGPEALDKKLKNNLRKVVTVKSITPNPESGTAVVRFRVEDRHNDGSIDPPTNWIATFAYSYVNAEISEKDRRINPLGFQVSSYRVDPEVGGDQ